MSRSALALLHQMHRIRLVEEEIASRYPQGKMRCPTHLSIGQEAVAASVGASLRPSDLAVSGHRAHAHYLGKGGDLRAMVAEIYGKQTGCSSGKGGSMHLTDLSAGFVGSTAIVGGTVPVGVGLGYGLKLRQPGTLSCVFLGDAVAETGVFAESVNFAVVKQLPVLFVCENNLYSVYSPLGVRQPPGREIWKMVQGMGMHAQHADGNDALQIFEVASAAVARIREGLGPVFLEFPTYRWREHCGPFYDNDIGYRSEAEFLAWKAKDPIARLQGELLRSGELSEAGLASMLDDIRCEIHQAFIEAESDPFPAADEAYTQVYA